MRTSDEHAVDSTSCFGACARMARSRAGTRDESKVTRSNSLHIMSIPARSFGQLDSKTEYLSVARGAVLLYSGKTRPRAPISMVHGSCHHFSPCARMIVKFISGVIYGTVRNYLPCWANRGELVLASYVTSVTMTEIQPKWQVGTPWLPPFRFGFEAGAGAEAGG